MARTKDEIRGRRFALLGGILMTIMLVSLQRWGLPTVNQEPAKGSIFFGDIEQWPLILRQHIFPLDLVFIAGFSYLLFYMVFAKLIVRTDSRRDFSIRDVPKMLLGVFIGFGAIGGALLTALDGWFTGLQGFVFMGLWAVGLMIVIGVPAFGLIYLLKKAEKHKAVITYEVNYHTPPVVKKAALRVKTYLNADDVPEDPPTDSPDDKDLS